MNYKENDLATLADTLTEILLSWKHAVQLFKGKVDAIQPRKKAERKLLRLAGKK